jgi:hypothetical protein
MKADGSDITEFAAVAGKHGLEIIPELQIPEKCQNIEVPANVCAWYGADEASSVDAFERGRQRYRGVKEISMLPVVAANYTMEVSRVTKNNGAFIDGVLFDHYVIRTKNTDFTELSDELAKLSRDIAGILYRNAALGARHYGAGICLFMNLAVHDCRLKRIGYEGCLPEHQSHSSTAKQYQHYSKRDHNTNQVFSFHPALPPEKILRISGLKPSNHFTEAEPSNTTFAAFPSSLFSALRLTDS